MWTSGSNEPRLTCSSGSVIGFVGESRTFGLSESESEVVESEHGGDAPFKQSRPESQPSWRAGVSMARVDRVNPANSNQGGASVVLE